MAWTGQSFSVGQILTAAQMNNLQADITAAFNKDAGAPQLANDYIVAAMIGTGQVGSDAVATNAINASEISSGAVGQSEVATNAIGQGELNTTTSNHSATLNAGSSTSFSLTGADYTLHFGYGHSSGGSTAEQIHRGGNGSTYNYDVGLYNNSGNNGTVYLRSRYVAASPPWNLGHGDIPLFIFAMLDKNTKEVVATNVATDPPWAYHGPHNLHPVDGKLLKINGLWDIPNIKDRYLSNDADVVQRLSDFMLMRNNLDDLSVRRVLKETSFTQEEKNIDIDIVPHLFNDYNPAKHVIVLLDPTADLTNELAMFHQLASVGVMPDEDVSVLLHNNMFSIRNDALPMHRTPAGVLTVGYKWKNKGAL